MPEDKSPEGTDQFATEQEEEFYMERDKAIRKAMARSAMEESAIIAKDLDNIFTYHAPKEDQPQRYEALRKGGKYLAEMILQNCPNSRERAIAVTKLREAIMWANASIACNE